MKKSINIMKRMNGEETVEGTVEGNFKKLTSMQKVELLQEMGVDSKEILESIEKTIITGENIIFSKEFLDVFLKKLASMELLDKIVLLEELDLPYNYILHEILDNNKHPTIDNFLIQLAEGEEVFCEEGEEGEDGVSKKTFSKMNSWDKIYFFEEESELCSCEILEEMTLSYEVEKFIAFDQRFSNLVSEKFLLTRLSFKIKTLLCFDFSCEEILRNIVENNDDSKMGDALISLSNKKRVLYIEEEEEKIHIIF